MKRRETRQVQVGGVRVGGNAPISVQSMLTTDTRNVQESLSEIMRLADGGCDIIRLAVPDAEAAAALKDICLHSPIPVVADIHYDYRLALAAIRAGANAIRINPGNMREEEGVREIATLARKRSVPIRVGVNSGSISKEIRNLYDGVNAQSLAYSAYQACQALEKFGFEDICVSAKASSPLMMIETYRMLSEHFDYPLHLGVTEAGTEREGTIRSAVGIGSLLVDGIGDTIRVSLTADPIQEVKVGISILRSLGLRDEGVRLISCPTCGRTEVDLMNMAAELEEKLSLIKAPLTVALMGCSVNGPGEAREADVGLAGGRGFFLLFRKGDIIRKVSQEEAIPALMAEIAKLLEESEQTNGI
ncbi:MAG: flavodoxin-dependent (E)-4-hydroxy-3-methylbut-2-enyl-diphosphate synthase [Eubacteriales bacterium]|nr:flavodoxin-dependent (E)-4-hydroxy-3-methylbut-2-enyl-diphosphate synthase [Eubacteriales bacterium]MDD4324061.1 flavodoxin-dependent (E)-4-hydroxy-3-methylbut-2-enyl-diphosphate synthase [Eubacteriales bacterium]MDD4541442.1 flavodoxin-dependent (E)-4-hydroxy-3-methylbut-2-enyl-diphosphate synthase [Eubacteriales bacterium]